MSDKKEWDMWCDTPEELKVVKGDGVEVPTINRIKFATDHLGVYGRDWGIKDIVVEHVVANSFIFASMSCIFWIGNWNGGKLEFETGASCKVAGGKFGDTNNQYRKSMETSAILNGLKRLGMCADLYQEYHDEKDEDEEPKPKVNKDDLVDLNEDKNNEKSDNPKPHGKPE